LLRRSILSSSLRARILNTLLLNHLISAVDNCSLPTSRARSVASIELPIPAYSRAPARHHGTGRGAHRLRRP
jgi:hypothetical protein